MTLLCLMGGHLHGHRVEVPIVALRVRTQQCFELIAVRHDHRLSRIRQVCLSRVGRGAFRCSGRSPLVADTGLTGQAAPDLEPTCVPARSGDQNGARPSSGGQAVVTGGYFSRRTKTGLLISPCPNTTFWDFASRMQSTSLFRKRKGAHRLVHQSMGCWVDGRTRCCRQRQVRT
jgi:hypothetical protein